MRDCHYTVTMYPYAMGLIKVNSHYAVNGNVNLRFRRLFHTTMFLVYLYFPAKTAAVNVNLHLGLRFCSSVKASTVLNHSKFTLRIRLRLRRSVNRP